MEPTMQDRWTVDNLDNMMAEQEIRLDEFYQRDGTAWKASDKAKLLESLVQGFAIGGLYFQDHGMNRDQVQQYSCLDGGHRLRAIREILGDDSKIRVPRYVEPIDGKYPVAGKTFAQLPRPIQKRIQRRQVGVTIIPKGWSQAECEQQFLRLNHNARLTPAELRRSFPGELKYRVFELAQSTFWKMDPASRTARAFGVRVRGERFFYEELIARFLTIMHAESLERPVKMLTKRTVDAFYEERPDLLPGDPLIALARRTFDYAEKALDNYPGIVNAKGIVVPLLVEAAACDGAVDALNFGAKFARLEAFRTSPKNADLKGVLAFNEAAVRADRGDFHALLRKVIRDAVVNGKMPS